MKECDASLLIILLKTKKIKSLIISKKETQQQVVKQNMEKCILWCWMIPTTGWEIDEFWNDRNSF